MAVSKDNFFLKIFLNGCFSKTAAKIHLSYKLHTFYILYCTVMLKTNKFLWFFFGRVFPKMCKYSEISLNITQKQYFSSKSLFSFHYSWIATPWISKKLFFKFSFLRVLWDLKITSCLKLVRTMLETWNLVHSNLVCSFRKYIF